MEGGGWGGERRCSEYVRGKCKETCERVRGMYGRWYESEIGKGRGYGMVKGL